MNPRDVIGVLRVIACRCLDYRQRVQPGAEAIAVRTVGRRTDAGIPPVVWPSICDRSGMGGVHCGRHYAATARRVHRSRRERAMDKSPRLIGSSVSRPRCSSWRCQISSERRRDHRNQGRLSRTVSPAVSRHHGPCSLRRILIPLRWQLVADRSLDLDGLPYRRPCHHALIMRREMRELVGLRTEHAAEPPNSRNRWMSAIE